MGGPKPPALPLGYTPAVCIFCSFLIRKDHATYSTRTHFFFKVFYAIAIKIYSNEKFVLKWPSF